MNSKSKALKATLAVATAVTAATSLPVGMVQQVQAKDDTDKTSVSQQASAESTRKTELESKVDESNKDVIATSTVLESAKTEKNNAKASLDKAQSAVTENNKATSDAEKVMDSTLAQEIIQRAQEKQKADEALKEVQAQKEALEATIKEKEDKLAIEKQTQKEAADKMNEMKDAFSQAKTDLATAEESKAQSEEKIKTLTDEIKALTESLTTKKEEKATLEKSLKTAQVELQTLKDEKADLEKTISEKQNKLKELQDAYDKTYTEEEIQALEQEVADLNTEIENLTKKVSDAETTISDSQKQIESNTSDIESLTEEIETAQIELNDAKDAEAQEKAKYDTAKAIYDDLKAKVDVLDAGEDTEELKQLKEELAGLETEYERVRQDFATKSTAAGHAANALEAAYVKYNDNLASFIDHIYETTDDEGVKKDIQMAKQELRKWDGQTIPNVKNENVKYYDSENYENTPFSLSNFIESLNYLKTANAIRAKEGVKELKLSYYLSVVAAVQNNVSSLTQYHSHLHNVGENLYLTSVMPDSTEFQKEDGTIDIDRLEAIGRGEVTPTASEEESPFLHWWIEEKVKAENGNTNTDDIGHYKNLANSGYGITGFAVNNVQRDGYYTFNQVFNGSDMYEYTVDDTRYYVTGTSIDDVKSMLDEWIVFKADDMKRIQKEADETLAAVRAANVELTSAKKAKDGKSAEITAYEDQVRADYEKATEAYTKATESYNTAKETTVAKQKVVDDKTKQKTALEEENKSLTKTIEDTTLTKDTNEKALTAKKEEFKSKNDELTTAKKSKDELAKEISDTNNEISELGNDLSETDTAITEKDEEVTSLASEVNDKNDEINNEEKTLSDKNTELSNENDKLAQTKENMATYQATIEEYQAASKAWAFASGNVSDLNFSIGVDKGKLLDLEDNITAALNDFNDKTDKHNLAVEAKAQWEAIKSGSSTKSRAVAGYGPFGDTVLDNLSTTVETYVQAKQKVLALQQALETAQQNFDTANTNYLTALEKYEKAEAAYNTAKNEYDLFIQTHGYITADTISVDSTAKYTGKAITPSVVVKDSKGNTVDASEYTIAYANNTEVGTATITVTMDGVNYVGQFTKTFEIVKDTAPTTPSNPSNSNNGNNGNTGNTGTVTPTNNGTNSDTNGNTQTANPTVTNSGKETTVKTTQKVKTGDEAPIVGFSLMAMLSSALYFFTKKKKED